ncbi:enoyl-CoA hydratase/isomerase family protein [Arthrobacter sp. ISL-28]|uniref:enoyl-CoA hydratase/isomerase family protein n=1 Tax=Arthrobacter sp. ISL-28 TaxID=2819108 RepID=UPI001BEC4D53|nr:enoyl-CoA hydratase/isomerase family protein [Arthrobacter sp. ISL-28]MBT2523345.1 enoyl-CoA hydratase/isomerase family protein [Arthrobacter sp. ISL-28]
MTGPAQETMTAALRVEHAGAVASIVIDNPKRRNALNQDMWQQFAPLLERLGADPGVKVVVVRGAGGNFSAGADISDLKAILRDPASGAHDGGHVTAAEKALAAFPKPTIAAIEGYCIGGAWQIAGACDIRIAAETATFGITPAKVGIVYPLSGIERLVRLAGPATAKYLLLTGDFITAAQAHGLGLLARVVPADGFRDEIQEFAARLTTRSQLSTQAMKQIIDAIAVNDPAVPAISGYWQDQMAASGEPEEGIGAFLAKREPDFRWNGGVRPA